MVKTALENDTRGKKQGLRRLIENPFVMHFDLLTLFEEGEGEEEEEMRRVSTYAEKSIETSVAILKGEPSVKSCRVNTNLKTKIMKKKKINKEEYMYEKNDKYFC